ncbi:MULTISPECIES: endo alpha-1,4 polygalactosaminidase [Actinoalloteichus]|uniref:Glycoside-hydrolase n=1 Tax=Actinoalloteichus fjordicus TaxID=1612552 RepID=A0AAC9LDI2_9PSEU|nr:MULTISPECIES: endo alpha-1,4 polygalactosaminidase [Actinoalloteichus]APU15646.1 Glycoside-hydrolase [Actinoalloteichus fjordicus]APU21706.1 Glycoside-hydrolase [Actinoalloteichus sp. GBA129-24]
MIRRVSVLALAIPLAASCAVAAPELTSGVTALPEQAWSAPPIDATFDYQIGGDYPLPDGVDVVSRDWYAGESPDGAYGICYVNAFQTQSDDGGLDRPDAQSNWPAHLVLSELGDDPNWGGEYLVDISTPEKQADAIEYLRPMIETCATKGFSAVEYDNLDSWIRFDGTPLEGQVPFGEEEAVEFATLLTEVAHSLELASAQKNTVELPAEVSREQIGFDFAIAESCGRWQECQDYRAVYGDHLIAIEYERQYFDATCAEVGDSVSVVLRNVAVSRPGTPGYQYDAC